MFLLGGWGSRHLWGCCGFIYTAKTTRFGPGTAIFAAFFLWTICNIGSSGSDLRALGTRRRRPI